MVTNPEGGWDEGVVCFGYPIPDWEAHIGRDPKSHLHFLGFQARGSVQAGSGLVEVAVVNVGRPFEILQASPVPAVARPEW